MHNLRPIGLAINKVLKNYLRVFILITFFILVLIFFLIFNKNTLIPQSVMNLKKTLNFSIYYPQSIPGGYSFSRESLLNNNQQKVAIYVFKDQANSIYMSQEYKPHNLDMNLFTQNFINKKNIFTTFGPATIGEYQKNVISTLVIGNDWIIINTNTSTPNPYSIETIIAQSLVQV